MNQSAEVSSKVTIPFSASPASHERIEALAKRCGTRVNLLIARGLALAEWVEDQIEQGRTVGAVQMGEDGFLPLRERPELLRAAQRPTLVPSVSPAKPQAPEPSPEATPVPVERAEVAEPEPSPVEPKSLKALAPGIDPAKLVARDRKNTPLKVLTKTRPPRKNLGLRALRINDMEGPVKSLDFSRRMAESRGAPEPINCNGYPLPATLSARNLPALESARDKMPSATHFNLTTKGDVCLFGFFPGKGKGWCFYNDVSLHWIKEPHANAGTLQVYSVDMAAEFLHQNPGLNMDTNPADQFEYQETF